MDIKEAIAQLVKDLYASEKGLLPYTLYSRYGLSPKDLVKAVKRLEGNGYIQVGKDNRLALTKKGKENAEGLIACSRRSSESKLDSDFFVSINGKMIGKQDPYIPSASFFDQYNKEGEENG